MQDTTYALETAQSSSNYSQTRNSTAVRPLNPIPRTQIDSIVPRLTSQLFESDIFVQIGGRQFQIPRDIFSSPGDSPNFFSLGFADFFASPSEVFPGLDRTGLLRPPAIEPPSVPNRSGDVFAELLHMLRGYPLEIRSAEHREQLLRDCRYYHLRGLEQRLIPHDIRINPITQRSEIVIRLEDLRPSGLEFIPDDDRRQVGWMGYARPYTNEKPHDLIVETNNETTLIYLTRVRFSGPTSSRVASLAQSAASKFSPDVSLIEENEDAVPITILDDADVTVNGQTDNTPVSPGAYPPELPSATKRPRLDEPEDGKWFVRRGQWRVRVGKPVPSDTRVRVSLFPVKLELYTRQKELNRTRGFLR